MEACSFLRVIMEEMRSYQIRKIEGRTSDWSDGSRCRRFGFWWEGRCGNIIRIWLVWRRVLLHCPCAPHPGRYPISLGEHLDNASCTREELQKNKNRTKQECILFSFLSRFRKDDPLRKGTSAAGRNLVAAGYALLRATMLVLAMGEWSQLLHTGPVGIPEWAKLGAWLVAVRVSVVCVAGRSVSTKGGRWGHGGTEMMRWEAG